MAKYAFLAYNKDRDVYDEVASSDNKDELKKIAESFLSSLKAGLFKDSTGEPYDWMELWDEEDDNGTNNICFH